MTRAGYTQARVVDAFKMLSMVKNQPPENPAKYRMFQRGVEISSSHYLLYREGFMRKFTRFNSRSKSFIIPKNQKARLDVARKTIQHSQIGQGMLFYGEIKLRSNCMKMLWGKELWRTLRIAFNLNHRTSSVKQGGGIIMHGYVWLSTPLDHWRLLAI